MGRWDQLPFDLLEKINESLELYQDKVKSKCVCTHWDLAFTKLHDDLRQQPPWLLLPFTSGSLCGLFHPFEKKLFVIDLPEAREKVFKGSGHGWVVTVQQNGSISVVNPLTRVQFALPPRYEFSDVLKYCPEKLGDEYLLRPYCVSKAPGVEPPFTLDSEHVRNYYIKKIALSCTPTRDGDFRAVAIYGEACRLAYCKLGDKKWSDFNHLNACCDVTFCGGKLYALTKKLELMVFDDIVSCPKLIKLIPGRKVLGPINTNLHLINSSDGGIMVARRKHKSSEVQKEKVISKTFDFEIYKMDLTSSSGWIRMESLAYDEIIFMGLGTQLGIKGRSGNRIYFTDHWLAFNCQDIEDCFDNGIFRFEDNEVESLGYEMNPRKIFPSPIWVMPNPY